MSQSILATFVQKLPLWSHWQVQPKRRAYLYFNFCVVMAALERKNAIFEMKYLQPRFSKANCSHYLQRNKKTQNCLLPLFFLHLNSFELVTSFYSRYLPTTYLKQNFNSSNNLFHLSESNVFRYSCEEHFAAESPSEN